MLKNIYTTVIILMISMSSVALTNAAPIKKPIDIISENITYILESIQKPEFKEQESLKDEIFSRITNLFSWEDMGKRSLGRIWSEQSTEQQQSFVDNFTQLLRNNYFNQLEGYSGEKVTYPGERIKGKYAEVQTVIIREDGTKIPVYYRLLTRNNEWKIYDVVIEGVSMVKNYKNQFDEILKKNTFDEFIQKIKEKAEKLKENKEV